MEKDVFTATAGTASSPGSPQKQQQVQQLLSRWAPPPTEGKYRTGLMVNNSMAGCKVEFVPLREGRRLTWYGCGPTVYDAAHMGHARTYIAFDIIRRILNDYFKYDVFMCMNITDIDDKIIMRSTEKKVEFATFARYWEAQFFNDMKILNVQLPDVVTRVSEYIPEVLKFIEKIMKNGYGYESGGSVYFDTQAFRASSNHIYGRMEPTAVNDQARVLEGEGDLGIVTEKRCPLDFALWKKAKEGEPFWDSPWGSGRPGWHIECSAMASSILGFPIDIHSGGVDLRFPHHDNELAQSEACYDQPQWVNYFLHSGHLHIKGSKMSKSLKNFITIKEALQVFTPRSIRILTLMHRWDAPMNYASDGDSMLAAAQIDSIFANFFASVCVHARELSEIVGQCVQLQNAVSLSSVKLKGVLNEQRWSETEIAMNERIMECQAEVHSALLDNFDTPNVLLSLRSLINETNIYMQTTTLVLKIPLILKAAKYVFSILKMFGVTQGNESDMSYVSTFHTEAESQQETGRLMDCLSGFRQKTRSTLQSMMKEMKATRTAAAGTATETSQAEAMNLLKQALSFCDEVRDRDLIELGFQLEDTPEGSVWKRSTREELLGQRERRVQEEERKAQQKQEREKALEQARLKKEAALSVQPSDYFRVNHPLQYAEFDQAGVPIRTIDGNEISKAKKEKLIKILDKHRKDHEEWKIATAAATESGAASTEATAAATEAGAAATEAGAAATETGAAATEIVAAATETGAAIKTNVTAEAEKTEMITTTTTGATNTE